jgi:hypothetical protein
MPTTASLRPSGKWSFHTWEAVNTVIVFRVGANTYKRYRDKYYQSIRDEIRDGMWVPNRERIDTLRNRILRAGEERLHIFPAHEDECENIW